MPVLRLHPLVRDVSRPREQENRHLATAAKLLVGATHGEQSGLPEDPAKWELRQFLVPHARQVLAAVSALPCHDRQARLDSVKAAYKSGRHLASTGAYAQARAVYSEVFAIRSRLLGVDHADTLSAHYGIARMAAGQGGYGEAETAFREIHESRERILGSWHPDTLNAVEERVLGPDQPDTLTIRYAIARMAAAQGRYDEAEKAYREVHVVEEEVLGPDHPDTLTTCHWVARMVLAQGRHDAAERLFRQVLATRENVLGVDHPNTLETLNGDEQRA